MDASQPTERTPRLSALMMAERGIGSNSVPISKVQVSHKTLHFGEQPQDSGYAVPHNSEILFPQLGMLSLNNCYAH
ncbi:hypothetical protein [Bradyrhizobium sp. sBnM-33]|uniref:hypothetical protein n=1 Tax=Bradyrhizobium sp. sBnM-33 TaxID=2831780 RepID=UPI001BCDCD1B|nr:hypothetical protein [Bradyrhizobium sp. sBnM-33]WOH52444.1 hypothetical protein RX328_09815 [Bradyrhizobium sp. sBnM-33]